MKKILFFSLILACLNITLCYAADIEVSNDMDSGIVEVYGSLGADNANRKVMMYALKEGETLKELIPDETQKSTEVIAAMGYSETDDQGNYSFRDIKFAEADADFVFHVTVDNSETQYISDPVYVIAKDTILSLNTYFQNKDADAIYQTIKNKIKTGDLKVDAPVLLLLDDDQTLKAVAEKMANREFEKTIDLIRAINQASFEAGMGTTASGEALELLLYPDQNDRMKEFADLAKAVNQMEEKSKLTTITALNALSRENRLKIFNSVSAIGYTDTDDLFDKLNMAVIMYQIKQCSGYGDLTGILQTHKDVIEGFSYSEYSSSPYINDLNKSLLTKSFNTTKELSQYITNYLKEAKTTPKPSGGNSHYGGGSSSGGKTTTPLTPIYPTPTPKAEQTDRFQDVDEVLWAKEAIQQLVDLGIISGKGDGRFAPQEYITREEFVKLLLPVFDLKPDSEHTETRFSDVQPDSWYTPYVETAYQHGIIQGITEDQFGVGSYISRQDMAVMVTRIMGMPENEVFGQDEFTDESQISDYAKASVRYLRSIGILSGYADGSFQPANPITRAEAAKLLYELLKWKKVN